MSVALDPRDFVLLSLEARNRGFKSTLAFRRWHQRHGVPFRVDGKKKWVCPAAIDAVIARMQTASNTTIDAAAAVVETMRRAGEVAGVWHDGFRHGFRHTLRA